MFWQPNPWGPGPVVFYISFWLKKGLHIPVEATRRFWVSGMCFRSWLEGPARSTCSKEVPVPPGCGGAGLHSAGGIRCFPGAHRPAELPQAECLPSELNLDPSVGSWLLPPSLFWCPGWVWDLDFHQPSLAKAPWAMLNPSFSSHDFLANSCEDTWWVKQVMLSLCRGFWLERLPALRWCHSCTGIGNAEFS